MLVALLFLGCTEVTLQKNTTDTDTDTPTDTDTTPGSTDTDTPGTDTTTGTTTGTTTDIDTTTPGTTTTTPFTTTTTPGSTIVSTTSTTFTGGTGVGGGLLPPTPSGGCLYGYAFTSFSNPAPTSPELHMVGVYDPPSNGIINVQVDRATDVTLVLSSYSAVQWNLVVAPGTNVQEVILNGFNGQTLVGAPAGAVVTNRSPVANWLGAYAYAWPSAPGGSDTPLLTANVQQITGLTLTSFAGCYASSGFSIQ